MKILLTGASGYIGKRLLPVLVNKEYEVVCAVRDPQRLHVPDSIKSEIQIITLDLTKEETLKNIPEDIDGAYYLVHSMSTSSDYKKIELECAKNFQIAVSKTNAKHVIYLTGIANEDELSEHLSSRLDVENELKKGDYNFTALRAGIIIGSGSASFEIMRSLVEKLPVMITPKWLNTKCQPIGIQDVIAFLSKSIFAADTYNENFDIGGPDILSYKDMLLELADVRGLKRYIYTVPIMSPKISSYWLYFLTSTPYKLAVALVHSMKVEVVCSDNRINDILDVKPMTYRAALERAFSITQKNEVISSWRDAFTSSDFKFNISDFIQVPTHGCFKDTKEVEIRDREKTIEKIWSIGGKTGWYYGNWLWKTRGVMDRLVGGVGLRRGRTSTTNITAGDALDFWRVLYADKDEGRLLLFAEMKLPGEAWLEFKIKEDKLIQTATFRPKGIWGRMYWYSALPFHGFIFKGMISNLVKTEN